MHLIKNDFEYRSWMLEAYFRQDNIYGDTLLTEEEMEDFLLTPARRNILASAW